AGQSPEWSLNAGRANLSTLRQAAVQTPIRVHNPSSWLVQKRGAANKMINANLGEYKWLTFLLTLQILGARHALGIRLFFGDHVWAAPQLMRGALFLPRR